MHDGSIIFIILGVAVVMVGVFAAVKYSRRTNSQFNELAETFNLEVVKGKWYEQPLLRGKHAGRGISIRNIYHSTGQSGYFTYRISYDAASKSPSKVDINISKYGGVSKFFLNIARLFGYRTVPFDNYEFEHIAIVTSKDDEYARRLIDLELQQDIENIARGRITLKGSEFTYEALGMAQDNEERIQGALGLLNKFDSKLARLEGSKEYYTADNLKSL
jgi:hypothetical protein